MLEFYFSIFFAVLLFLCSFTLFFLEIRENGKDIFEYDFNTIVAAFLCLFLAFYLVFCTIPSFYKNANPPDIIEVDGYIYHLCDDVPDETVEQYGHKYILLNEG